MANSTIDHGNFLGQDLRILDGIASWCGALHGSMSLSDAVEAVSKGILADIAVLSRDPRSEGKARVVAFFDAHRSDRDLDALRRAYAQDVLGVYYTQMQKGTSWFLSDHQDDPTFERSSALASWQLSRGVVDIVVVSLEASGLQNDFIEFHFSKVLNRSEKEQIEAMLPTLVRAWAGRKAGLVTQAHIDERILAARVNAKANRIKPDAAILGISNPARLSRAEFRVCLLLSRGLSIKGAMDELGVSEATIRSHLRSIYSKTHTSGLAELVYRLLSNGTDDQNSGFAQL